MQTLFPQNLADFDYFRFCLGHIAEKWNFAGHYLKSATSAHPNNGIFEHSLSTLIIVSEQIFGHCLLIWDISVGKCNKNEKIAFSGTHIFGPQLADIFFSFYGSKTCIFPLNKKWPSVMVARRRKSHLKCRFWSFSEKTKIRPKLEKPIFWKIWHFGQKYFSGFICVLKCPRNFH